MTVTPELVAEKEPLSGVRRNLSESELSNPSSHLLVPASCSCSIGSPAEVWLIVSVVVAVRAVKVGEDVKAMSCGVDRVIVPAPFVTVI